jgi:hypothetical protein
MRRRYESSFDLFVANVQIVATSAKTPRRQGCQDAERKKREVSIQEIDDPGQRIPSKTETGFLPETSQKRIDRADSMEYQDVHFT